MPKQQIEKRYWDSNCFLGWLLEEKDKVADLKQVLDQANQDKIHIVTSAFTLTEVLMIRGKDKIVEDNKQMVRSFFDKSYIHLMPVYKEQAMIAQDLVWDHGVHPKDAIHLASAIFCKVSLFNTYDHGLLNKRQINVDDHQLRIEKPELQQPTLIP